MALASLPAYFHQVGLATVSGDVAFSLGCDAVALGLLGAAFSYTYAACRSRWASWWTSWARGAA